MKKLSTLPVDFWPSRSIFPIYPFCLSPSPSVKAFQVREFHRMPKVIKNCLMNKPLNNRMLLRWEKVGRKLCALRKYSPHFATFIRSFHAILCHKLNETLFKYYHKIAQVFFTFDLFIQWPRFTICIRCECQRRWKKNERKKNVKDDVDEIHVKLYHHQIFKCDIFV